MEAPKIHNHFRKHKNLLSYKLYTTHYIDRDKVCVQQKNVFLYKLYSHRYIAQQ